MCKNSGAGVMKKRPSRQLIYIRYGVSYVLITFNAVDDALKKYKPTTKDVEKVVKTKSKKIFEQNIKQIQEKDQNHTSLVCRN